MKRSDLSQAVEHQNRIEDIDTAAMRCQDGIFKAAFLVVRGIAHGAAGVDGRPQNAETLIPLDHAFVVRLLHSMRNTENASLTQLGIVD